MAAHPLPWFLALAFGWTWTWIFLAALTRAGRLDLPMRGDLGVLLARVGPAVAAIACLAGAGGGRAVRGLLGRLKETRVGPRWIALALGMDIPLYLVTFAVGSRLDARLPGVDWALLASLPGAWLPAFTVSLVTSGIGEELGWRGLLLPGLLRRHRPLTATLMLVPVISLWHLNVDFVARGLADGWTAFLAAYLPALAGRLALTLPSLCVLTLLYLRGRGSLLLMAAAHAAINASYGWVDACLPHKPPQFWLLYGGMLWGVGAWAGMKLAPVPVAPAEAPA